VKKGKYSEERIREILSTAYPGKSEAEIDAMVQETMDQYLVEATPKSPRKGQSSQSKNQ
jgi:lauroyl/myristoyl acyltransferase